MLKFIGNRFKNMDKSHIFQVNFDNGRNFKQRIIKNTLVHKILKKIYIILYFYTKFKTLQHVKGKSS